MLTIFTRLVASFRSLHFRNRDVNKSQRELDDIQLIQLDVDGDLSRLLVQRTTDRDPSIIAQGTEAVRQFYRLHALAPEAHHVLTGKDCGLVRQFFPDGLPGTHRPV